MNRIFKFILVRHLPTFCSMVNFTMLMDFVSEQKSVNIISPNMVNFTMLMDFVTEHKSVNIMSPTSALVLTSQQAMDT